MTSSNFPSKEAEVIASAQEISEGIEKNLKLLPDLPCTLENFKSGIANLITKRGLATEARAAADKAAKEKENDFADFSVVMRQMINYLVLQSKLKGFSLKIFGLNDTRKKGTGERPGKCVSLEIIANGADWIKAIWGRPFKGSAIYSYAVYCKKSPNGVFELVGKTTAKEINLVGLPKDVTLEFKVAAVNAAGEGEPSNIVKIIL